MTPIEQRQSKVNGIMNTLRHQISPYNEQALDALEDLEVALCDLETEAMQNEERLLAFEGLKYNKLIA